MRDLHLWRLLQSGTLDPAELTPLLTELAELSLAERVPFQGLLGPVLAHPDAELRRLGLRALAGVAGRLGLQRLVQALGDAEETVRREAVEGLRQSVLGKDWARWVHVLFHPDPIVRAQAIDEHLAFPPPELYALYLLPDPVHGDRVRQRLQTLEIDRYSIPLLFDFVHRGQVSVPLARRMCRAMGWNDWLTFLGDLVPRQYDMAGTLADALQPEWLVDLFAHYRPDRLDDLLSFYWEPDSPESGTTYHRDFFALLWQATLDESLYFQQWIVFTLMGLGAQRGDWPQAVVEICAVFYPPFVGCAWVPVEARRAGLAGFYRAAGRTPRVAADVVRPLIAAEVCWKDNVPDLYAMGALLHALERHPYQHLVEWVGLPAIAASFHADTERSLPLLGVPDNSPLGRTFLIRELCLFQGPLRYHLMALLIDAVPGDALDFLDSLDGLAACQLLVELLKPVRRSYTENKTTRLVELLARKIAAGQVARFLQVWLDRDQPETATLAPFIFSRLIHNHDSKLILPAVAGLDPVRLRRFLQLIPFCAGFPYDEEVQLALRLARHVEADVREWAAARLRENAAFQAARQAEEDAGQERVLRQGLCAELAQRTTPVVPDVETCQALLASHDPPADVEYQLTRFLADDPAFLTRLDVEMVRHWKGESRLPFLGHVWLYRWDQHRAALSLALQEQSIAGVLRRFCASRSRAVARRVWQAMLAVMEQWRWYSRPRLEGAWTSELADVLVEALRTPLVDLVAAIAKHWREYAAADSPLVANLRQRLTLLMPEITERERELFAPWIDARGLGSLAEATVIVAPLAKAETIDLDSLVSTLHSDDEATAATAAVRLFAHGDDGIERLAVALDARLAVRWPLHLLKQLEENAPAALRPALRRFVACPDADAEARFRVGRALWTIDDHDLFEDCLKALCASSPKDWFTIEDLAWVGLWTEATFRDLYLRLIYSTQTHAHGAAVVHLVSLPGPDADVYQALLDFLEHGTGRMRDWRLQAAEWLYRQGERDVVLPLLLSKTPKSDPEYPALLAGVQGPLVLAVTQSLLMAGQGEDAEAMLLEMLNHGHALSLRSWTPSASREPGLRKDRVDPIARQEALGQLLAHGTSVSVRGKARKALRSGLGRSHKLRRVAETFAWGVRIGRQLTGKLFTLEMIAGEDLGYTRLHENKLYVSPLPILRGQQDSREVVRALILHEYGHHLYHKGETADAVWQQAQDEKLHRLLNLVSDEHLERNLRTKDQSFGDQLKKLGAYAFQHTTREVPVFTLLEALRSQAFAVLTQTSLGVARKPGCVAVNNGRVLLQMEKAGMSFARFVRALRMGLGNRHGDAKVEAGLKLFKSKFRESTMPQLMDITHELRKIFGEETDLLNAFNQDVAVLGDADELADASEGITNEELQAEIRRALEGATNRPKGKGDKGWRGYNLDPSVNFDEITHVIPKPFDPVRHASYAQRVARPAEKMRRMMLQLGLGLVPRRMRIQGKSFDRTRTRAMVLKGDPRVLIGREVRYTTDLFLGVLIDCSGSMSVDENIEKAKLFGTLLAEAARGLRGVDLRLWGFTDRTIYDCGNALRPAVHDLEPEDGNNDAAALWHAALTARASRRRAKLLVMISDGSPTGCSVAALTALVRTLTTRMKMLCAQVAVRPLEDVCFPHYVLLEDEQVDECVRRFGMVMMKLVRQALRG